MLPANHNRKMFNRLVQTICRSRRPVRGDILSDSERVYFHGNHPPAIPSDPATLAALVIEGDSNASGRQGGQFPTGPMQSSCEHYNE